MDRPGWKAKSKVKEPANVFRWHCSGFNVKSDHPTLEKTFFLLILLMYLVILLGNGVLILVTILDTHLHTPMYFFLGNLSFLDICYTTSSVPLVLDGFLTPRKTISFSGCAVQMFLSFAMGATECVLLGMMAFDRYVAICNPLRYPVVMSKAAYVPMAISSWILAVLKLACADISINVISMGVANVIFLGVPVLFIFVSYTFILTTILRIPSAEGRRKAFSTCSAHLTVVIVFYGTILFMYGKPKSKDPLGTDKQDVSDKLISLFYGVLTPMLNPIIYSLRNKDVKVAVRNLVGWKCLIHRYIQQAENLAGTKVYLGTFTATPSGAPDTGKSSTGGEQAFRIEPRRKSSEL
ncbi:hypothetical protein A6R68_22507 [Neotoma lepida]|uniref:Olfactory receptor n=1 Tax=Neotoma lepida TaxID=56216 RepID=A0A1A6HZ33_NEOLE|nr:hypothetical protein A6R68_22507 [Neotoma lepida]